MSDKKIAVYVCKGCDIGKSIDVDALQGALEDDEYEDADLEFDRFQIHDCLCSQEGIDLIGSDVKDGVNAIVVGACSPRFKTNEFLFDGVFTDRVNLREHVVWSHEPGHEDTQMAATDYVAMGLIRAQRGEVPEAFSEEIDRKILVVGGGHTGMTAALDAAKAGTEVVLVEKEEALGGWGRKFNITFPTSGNYRDLETLDLPSRVKEIEANERIKVHTSAGIKQINGQPGQFDVELEGGETFRVGAIVQATGWKPYDASKLDHLGFGKFKNVVTNVQMEEMIAAGKVTRPSDGNPALRVAFIQCAGSRDEEHLPYCSAVCCRVSMKQALWLRENNSDAQAYVLYKDIRSPGQFEGFYLKAQEDSGIFFTKGEVEKVEEGNDKNLLVEMTYTLIDERVKVEADLLVLATGMVPNAADGESVRKLLDAKATIAKGEEGAQLEAAKKAAEELKDHEGTAILNLNYRQGPDLPVLRYDFPDSHFICFPYETRRTGIYAAGCMRAPNDRESCREDAQGAALKAVQALELLSQGRAVHPRWSDESFPDFFLQRCTQCKRCTEECPFGTLNEDAKGTPQPNPTRCRRCGICLGSCPERIISFKDYSVEIISNMLKAVHIPDEDEDKPRILCFMCENDAYPAMDLAGMKRIKHSPWVRIVPVRCLGSVNVVWIGDALSSGYDGILLMGCKSGDDYQCHFIKGSELMGTRGENIQDKLKQLVLEEERVRVEEVAITDYEKIPQIINEFAEEIEDIGMNPFKGF
ncbi:MAG: hydrogenase iron-sulfur subunit [Planctomycetota bacterium]|jgi:quinone-modifying oxidoreductase subunit QmoB